MLTGKYIIERGFLMEDIISKIYDLIKSTDNLIEFEERMQIYIYQVFISLLGDVLSQLNEGIKKKKQEHLWHCAISPYFNA